MRLILLCRILVFVLLPMGFLSSCMRDDDEPNRPTRPISRLYVSTSDFQNNSSLPSFRNIHIVDPADMENDFVLRSNSSFTSDAKGGDKILFSPDMRLILQSSTNLNDTIIQILSVANETGQVSTSGGILSNLLSGVRGMTYYSSSDMLLLINTDANSNNLFVYDRLRGKAASRVSKPTVRAPLGTIQPSAIFVRETGENAFITYMVTTGANGKIEGFNNLSGELINRVISKDSVMQQAIIPNFSLTISGTTNLVDASYSPVLDLLVVTDYDNANNGRLLFFDQFSTKTTTGSLTPSRIIAGNNTLLRNPVSVELDLRERAKYLYVADSHQDTRAVLRFLIQDEGNVEPKVLKIMDRDSERTPVSISLDARGTIPEED